MEILKVIPSDVNELLVQQVNSFKSVALMENNHLIPPMVESGDSVLYDLNRGTILKAVVNNEIIGSVRAYTKKDTCYIKRLFVVPEYEGKGIGSMLLKEIESVYSHSYRFELFTGKKALVPIAFYQKHGYKVFREDALDIGPKIVYLEKENSN